MALEYKLYKEAEDFITLEESKDIHLGKVGTPDRDAYEEELRLYAIGAAYCTQTVQGNECQCEIRH